MPTLKRLYLRLLSLVVLLALPFIGSSFNLIEDSSPIRTSNEAALQSPLINTSLVSHNTPEKKYKLKWGDIECDCKSEEYPNLYHCENQSLTPRQVRKLIRKKGGFQVVLEDQAQPFQDLMVLSKFTKDMGDYPSQLEEMGENFNEESLFWKEAEKGDVYHFSFNNGQNDHFEFDLVINNRKKEFVFGSRVEMGDFKFNINLMNDAGVVHMELEDLKKMAQFPFRVRKNNESFYKIAKATIFNPGALRQDERKRVNRKSLDISTSLPILDAFPGDRIFMNLEADDGQKIKFNIIVRKNSAWDGRKRDFGLHWGKHEFRPGKLIILSKTEVAELVNESLYLSANGGKHRMNFTDTRFYSHGFVSKNGKHVFKEVKTKLEESKPGKLLYLQKLKSADGYLLPRLRVLVDIDWREVFAERPGLTVAEKEGRVVLNNVTSEDISKLFDLEDFPYRFYHFEIDGDGIPGRKYKKEELQQLISEKMPQRRMVISRAGTLF